MRKTVFKTLIIATLPLAAGFAFAGFAFTPLAQAQMVPSTTMVPPTMAASAPDMALLRMGQLETQIRDLTGQLEQREYQLRQLQESFDRFAESTNARLSALEGGAPNTQHAPSPQPNQGFANQGFSTSLQQHTPPQPQPQPQSTVNPTDFDAPYTAGAPGTLGHMDAPETPSDTLTSGRAQSVSPAQAYDTAFGYLQAKNYTDAENAFQDFIKTYPTHALAGNAQYWLGETYYAQTQYTAAARTFAKAFQDYPQGQKAPDALFKLALTLDQMDKREDACLTLSELHKRFPTGPASILRRVGEESARMQCAG